MRDGIIGGSFYASISVVLILVTTLFVHAQGIGKTGNVKDISKKCAQDTKTIQNTLITEAKKRNIYSPALKKKIDAVKYLPVYEVASPGQKAAVKGSCSRKLTGDTNLKKKGEQKGECKESLVVFKGSNGEKDTRLCDAKVVKVSDQDKDDPLEEARRKFFDEHGIDEFDAATYNSYLGLQKKESESWPRDSDEKIPSPYNKEAWDDFRIKDIAPQKGDSPEPFTPQERENDRIRGLCAYERIFGSNGEAMTGLLSVRIYRSCPAISVKPEFFSS
jgi:hypothetical protein